MVLSAEVHRKPVEIHLKLITVSGSTAQGVSQDPLYQQQGWALGMGIVGQALHTFVTMVIIVTNCYFKSNEVFLLLLIVTRK